MAQANTIEIILSSVDRMSADLKKVQNRLGTLDKGMIRTSGTVAKVDERFSTFSGSIKGLGAQIVVFNQGLLLAQQAFRALGAVIGGPIRTAISFESAFAGVKKTVDASDATLKRIKQDFIDLSTEIPVTAEELFGIGEVAGQLGVRAEDIVKFSEQIAILGVTTDISGEQAALALTRFQNILGGTADDIDRVVSTIVGLGNAFAARESEIVDIAVNLASFGRQVGLTEGQVLAFSVAIKASGGIARASSTAFQKIALTMKDAAIASNKTLDAFAKIADVTSKEFKKAFEEDAAKAIVLFLEGLRKVTDEGRSVRQALASIGLADQLLIREIVKVVGNIDQLNEALRSQKVLWEENTAATEEAEKRFETTASKVQVFTNRFKALQELLGKGFIATFGPAIEGPLDRLLQLLDDIANRGDRITAINFGIAGEKVIRGEIIDLQRLLDRLRDQAERPFLFRLLFPTLPQTVAGIEKEIARIEKLQLQLFETLAQKRREQEAASAAQAAKDEVDTDKAIALETKFTESLDKTIEALKKKTNSIRKTTSEGLRAVLTEQLKQDIENTGRKITQQSVEDMEARIDAIVRLTEKNRELAQGELLLAREREKNRRKEAKLFEEEPGFAGTPEELDELTAAGVKDAEEDKKIQKDRTAAQRDFQRRNREMSRAFLESRDAEIDRIKEWGIKQKQELTDLVEKWREKAPEIADEYEKALARVDEVTAEKISKIKTKVDREIERIGHSAGSRLTEGILQGMETGRFDLQEFFADTGRQIVQALLNAAIQALLIDPLVGQFKKLLGGLGGGITGDGGGGALGFLGGLGSIGKLFGFAKGGIILPRGMPIPAFAHGGIVLPQSVPVGAIRKFQQGGIVRGPTLGLLGEEGPEAIIPLKRTGGERREETMTQNIFIVDQRRPNLAPGDVELIMQDSLDRRRGPGRSVENIIKRMR